MDFVCKGTGAPFMVILFLWWEMANAKQDLTIQPDSWKVKKKKIRVYPLNSLFINIMGAVVLLIKCYEGLGGNRMPLAKEYYSEEEFYL